MIIWKNILQLNIKKNIAKFSFKVNIKKDIYIKMIKQRYMSTLLELNSSQILKGIQEVDLYYKKKIIFNDKLNCIILIN